MCSLFASAVTVKVANPTSTTATVSTTFTVDATASSSHPITGWHIYADGKNVFGGNLKATHISTALTLPEGKHSLIVRAWDQTGAYGSYYLTANVQLVPTPTPDPTPTPQPPPDAGPTPPADALVVTDIEQRSTWFSCASSACSGSSKPVAFYVAPFQTDPSQDGSSTLFHIDGSAYADVLWAAKIGPALSSKTHYILDYWIRPNADTLTNAEALEFDVVFAYGGRKWDFSHQFHYSGTHLDTWDGSALKWIHTNIAMPKLDPTQWHHIKLYDERVGTQTHNISFTVDGVTYPVPDTYTWRNTRLTNWSNSVNVQVQLDDNSHGGPVSEYVDKLTLYAW